MSQLSDLVNNYININIDLQKQINNLENALVIITNKNNLANVVINTKNIEQDTSIKLEYLQYLIMFDISASNGLFLPANLEIAKEVLKNNGNRLQYNFINYFQ